MDLSGLIGNHQSVHESVYLGIKSSLSRKVSHQSLCVFTVAVEEEKLSHQQAEGGAIREHRARGRLGLTHTAVKEAPLDGMLQVPENTQQSRKTLNGKV